MDKALVLPEPSGEELVFHVENRFVDRPNENDVERERLKVEAKKLEAMKSDLLAQMLQNLNGRINTVEYKDRYQGSFGRSF